MLFPTLEFAVFFAVVLPVSWFLGQTPLRWKIFLLLASYFFYGAWDWRFIALIMGSTLVNQMLANEIHRSGDPRIRKLLVQIAVGINLSVLGFFKYYGFFILSLEGLLFRMGLEAELPLLEIILPVGISFFTFQAMSYVIDVYRKEIPPSTILDFATYLALFPQLVAGPIVRASELLPQLKQRRDPRTIPVGKAFRLIISGLFKKTVLADMLATAIVEPVFSSPADHSGPEILLGVYGYAAQIYCDFSAYSDIAIGVALLIGLKFPDNFNAPYTAVTLQDFWRRWHISLSSWLRDYLYIPLGGSRNGRLMTYRNLIITMLLGGLWHGASWMFVIWGALHGGGLALERLLDEWRGKRPPPSRSVALLRGLLTFHFVCLAWIFFRAPSMEVVGDILTGIFAGWDLLPGVDTPVYLALGLGLASQFMPKRWLLRIEDSFARQSVWVQGFLLGLALLLIDALAPPGVAAFIYFQF